MTERVFKVVCNSEYFLTAEEIALALLKHVTLTAKNQDVSFGVVEVERAAPLLLEPKAEFAA